MSNKGCTLFEGSRERVESRLRGDCRGLHRPPGRLYGVLCLRGRLLGGSPTLADLGNDHRFVSKEYIFIGTRPFGKLKAKLRELMLKVDNIIPL